MVQYRVHMFCKIDTKWRCLDVGPLGIARLSADAQTRYLSLLDRREQEREEAAPLQERVNNCGGDIGRRGLQRRW